MHDRDTNRDGAVWWHDARFYHIFPMRYFGAPDRNDFASPNEPRLNLLRETADHIVELGFNALYLGPVFESTSHGYDTVDYYHVDRRLGDNATLRSLVQYLRARNIRVVLDGVFNHVGRNFWAFYDLVRNGEQSEYRNWFRGIDFSRDNRYGDGFSYDGWEGHDTLVSLNLENRAVREHLFGAVRWMMDDLGIDGLRLDVAYMLNRDFMRELSNYCKARRPDFFLLGEMIHGNYTEIVNAEMLDSATNYEVYKGLWSSHNDGNYYEIAHSFGRQFGARGLYRNIPLYNFADNHDVDRVASSVKTKAHLYPLYTILYTMPGIPSVYYGSEFGIAGTRSAHSDSGLRPSWIAVISGTEPVYASLKNGTISAQPGSDVPESASGSAGPGPGTGDLSASLADYLRKLGELRTSRGWLATADYEQLQVANETFVFACRPSDLGPNGAEGSRVPNGAPGATANGTEALLVTAVNLSHESREVSFASPGGSSLSGWFDASLRLRPDASGMVSVRIPPTGAVVLIGAAEHH